MVGTDFFLLLNAPLMITVTICLLQIMSGLSVAENSTR